MAAPCVHYQMAPARKVPASTQTQSPIHRQQDLATTAAAAVDVAHTALAAAPAAVAAKQLVCCQHCSSCWTAGAGHMPQHLTNTRSYSGSGGC